MATPLSYPQDFKSDPNAFPSAAVKPRIILHGGAGNITRANLPPELWTRYQTALLRILRSTAALLDLPPGARSPNDKSNPPADALSAAVHAVTQLENDPLFNAGVGAVFNREGRIELEAGVMVSRGARKRGVGVSGLKHVRSPIGLAAEVLRRGEDVGGDAQGHVQLNGEGVESLARKWGCEMCEERVFYTRKRWEEHKRGLECEKRRRKEEGGGEQFDWKLHMGEAACDKFDDGPVWDDGEPGWDGVEYLPQGTVGCVVLDCQGTLAVATSTGGITNKLPGRIGDTPTLGAGMWAEEWQESDKIQDNMCTNSGTYQITEQPMGLPQWAAHVAQNLLSLEPPRAILKCFPQSSLGLAPSRLAEPSTLTYTDMKKHKKGDSQRAVAMGGTGNGDSFLRLCAVRTAAARARFASVSLADAVEWMAGPDGELQRSAGDGWGTTGEGEGGIIGIELNDGKGKVVTGFNRAMFRAWIDDNGRERCMVFRNDYQ